MTRKPIIIFFMAFMPLTSIMASASPSPLIESQWLANNLSKVTILDVRKDIKSFTRKPLYKKDKKTGRQKLIKVGGHITGASLVDYSKVRTSKMINGKKVTRVIPAKMQFESLMQEAGLNKNDTIVIVTKGQSNADMTIATRLYWQLKYYGHSNMSILNGGMAQWILDKRKVSTTSTKKNKGNWVAASTNNAIFASSNDVTNAVKNSNTQLIDTRSISLYMGTYRKSYVYAKGHIEGAKNYPNELLTVPSLPVRFINKHDSQAIMSKLGINTTSKSITYCNSGHLASGSWFLLSEIMGNKDVKLYDGSMHQWTLEKQPTKSVIKH